MPEQKQENSRIVKLKKTQVLFRENDDSQDLFIVRSGSLKIVRKHQGREVVLDTLTTGMVAGEITSIDNSKRTATAIADSETELIKIPKDEFKVIYEKIPDWFRKIATILVQRLRAVDEKICRAMSMDHTRHVAAGISLLSYSDRCVQNTEGYEFDQRFLEGELSDMLSIPPAEVQGAIEALVGKKVLACAGGKIVLADRITCEQLCAELLLADEKPAGSVPERDAAPAGGQLPDGIQYGEPEGPDDVPQDIPDYNSLPDITLGSSSHCEPE